MFSKEETNLLFWLFWRFVVLGGIIAILSFFRHHGTWLGVPLGSWVILLCWMVYSFCSWQNKKELLKRCVTALPVAFLAVLSLRVAAFGTYLSHNVGVLLFLSLTIKTRNLKQHYVITLTVAAILIAILSIMTPLYRNILKSAGEHNIVMAAVCFLVACGIAVLSFYEAYCVRASRPEKPLELLSLVVKSMKVAGAFFLLMIVFLGSQALCEYFHIGFGISFGISVLIAMGFWWACRVLKINNMTVSDSGQVITKKAKQANGCECCGKLGIPQELLFSIDSGQRVCAACLKKMEQQRNT